MTQMRWVPLHCANCFILRPHDEAITIDPSSPWGYKTKHAALHGAGRYSDAIQTFETMLSKMQESADPQIRGELSSILCPKMICRRHPVEHRDQYVDPSSTRNMIRGTVQRTIRHSPRVLINTTTGRLYDKAMQAEAFVSLPIFHELVSSMTTHTDSNRIKREVRRFFRYAVLSHRWDANEPTYQQVMHMTVYDLEQSPSHNKLQMFCEVVRDLGFYWAWADTCCINKEDNSALQETLVAQFSWYRGSAIMIVYLRSICPPGNRGDLMRNSWNTRSWTLQEYVAAKVIRFYTEDWTPYLNLDALNHKESPEIISEMERVAGVPAQHLLTLRPGLSNIREKLRLASTRRSALVEDEAYSLLGIFSVSGIPTVYGEGQNALGRLLAHILSGSGDTSILGWTGQSGPYNSCLPARITAFNCPATSHLPLSIESARMEDTVSSLRTSLLDLDLALKLYERLNELPAPWFAGNRMKLPCIAFKLPPLLLSRTTSGRVYRVKTSVFGMVEIKTRQDLSRMSGLYLAHPWLDTLLDSINVQRSTFEEGDVAEPSSPNMDEDTSDEEIEDDSGSSPNVDDDSVSDNGDDSSPYPERELPPMDRETRALRLVARLGQSFGALLFIPASESTRRRTVAYRRVAADSTITVQMQENVYLADILNNVRILDVL